MIVDIEAGLVGTVIVKDMSRSKREIAARYGGTVQFEQKGGMFYASLLLKLVPDGMGDAC